MYKVAIFLVLAIMGLSYIAAFLTMMHFIFMISKSHFLIIAGLLAINKISHINLRYLITKGEESNYEK